MVEENAVIEEVDVVPHPDLQADHPHTEVNLSQVSTNLQKLE